MQDFLPGPYTALAETQTGKAVWQFLNSQEALAQLVASTVSRRPAIEGLQGELLQLFGAEIKSAQWKLMISRMVRQIMQQLGYVREPRPLGISGPGLFKQGARYKPNSQPNVL